MKFNFAIKSITVAFQYLLNMFFVLCIIDTTLLTNLFTDGAYLIGITLFLIGFTQTMGHLGHIIAASSISKARNIYSILWLVFLILFVAACMLIEHPEILVAIMLIPAIYYVIMITKELQLKFKLIKDVNTTET